MIGPVAADPACNVFKRDMITESGDKAAQHVLTADALDAPYVAICLVMSIGSSSRAPLGRRGVAKGTGHHVQVLSDLAEIAPERIFGSEQAQRG